MKLLDYLYVFSFAGASALIMQQMFNITLLSICTGIISFTTCYRVTKSECEKY